MSFIDFNKSKKVKIWEGVTGSLYHSANNTFLQATIEDGISIPEHQHVHEQWTCLIEGELEFSIDGEKQLLKPGMTAFIPSNIPHSANARTRCRVIDCFTPVREDFVALEKQTTA